MVDRIEDGILQNDMDDYRPWQTLARFAETGTSLTRAWPAKMYRADASTRIGGAYVRELLWIVLESAIDISNTTIAIYFSKPPKTSVCAASDVPRTRINLSSEFRSIRYAAPACHHNARP